MQYLCPKYMPYGFYQVLCKFYLYGDCVNFCKKIVEFILIVYDTKTWTKNMVPKKLAMSTKQMQDIFSSIFFLCPQGEHLQCFWEKSMSSFVHKHFTRTYFLFSQQTSDLFTDCRITYRHNRTQFCHENRRYVLIKCLRTKLDIFFAQKQRKYILHPFGRHC